MKISLPRLEITGITPEDGHLYLRHVDVSNWIRQCADEASRHPIPYEIVQYVEGIANVLDKSVDESLKNSDD